MSDAPLTKQQLRSQIREEKRKFLASTPISDQHILSEKLLCRLEQFPAFAKAKTVLAYYSLPDEVFTHTFVERWARHKTIILPKVVGDSLTLHKFAGPSLTLQGAYGILEPTTPEFTDYSAIDLVIVPGVAFDCAGNRLGRGRGYYDKMFAHILPSDIVKIGICYPFQLVEHVPATVTDVRMDAVIAEI